MPEVTEVIALIAKHNLVLATGHSAPQEALLLLREGRRHGVQHMVVTHAMKPPVLMNVSQMQEAAKLGAFIEFVGGSPTGADAEVRISGFADAIRRVGPAFCILSSDLGQQGNALPATASVPSSLRCAARDYGRGIRPNGEKEPGTTARFAVRSSEVRDGTCVRGPMLLRAGQVMLLADQGLLLVLGERGDLALVKAAPDQFTELAKIPGVIEGKTWNHPVLVRDVLLVRNAQQMPAFRLPLERSAAVGTGSR